MTFEPVSEADIDKIVAFICQRAKKMADLPPDEMMTWLNNEFSGISIDTAAGAMREAARRVLGHDADELRRLADAEAQ